MPTKVPIPRCVALVAACLAALLAGPVATSSAFQLGERQLSEGSRGADVKALQQLLRKAGFGVPVNGIYGRGTWRAVRRVERELGLPVDGTLALRDLRRLESALQPAESNGGVTYGAPVPKSAASEVAAPREVPGEKAKLTKDGLAIAPAGAPQAVKNIIAAGNRIARLPYRYGGGHAGWKDTAYDCSGSVSFALNGAKLLKAPMASGGFMTFAKRGPGKWVTIYANPGHMYMMVAGLRFDTGYGRSSTGSRWSAKPRPTSGYAVRHPEGL